MSDYDDYTPARELAISFAIVFVLVGLLLVWYVNEPATEKQLTRLVEIKNKQPHAKKVIADWLQSDPNPTIWAADRFETKINTLLEHVKAESLKAILNRQVSVP